MGRPLNKKYFGNRNLGTDGTITSPDAGIGGQSVASVSITTAGSYTKNQANALTSLFPAPSIAEGVTAIGSPEFSILTATISGGQTIAYAPSDILTITSSAVSSTFAVTLSAAVSGIAITATTGIAGQVTVASGTYITGQSVTIVGTGGEGLISGHTYYVLVGGSSVTAIQLTDTYTNAVNNVANLITTVGAIATTTFTLGTTYNTISGVTIAASGLYPQSAIAALNTAQTAVNSGHGAGALITPATFGLGGVKITNVGDGYLSTQSLGLTISSGAGVATAVLTVPNAIVTIGTTLDREPAILGDANLTGVARINSDIISQRGSKRYKVQNQDGVGIVYLVAAAPAVGQMTITATDSAGNTYYVTKLKSHLALLTQNSGSGFQFASDSEIEWTFGSAIPNVSVTIQNG